jgi:hypothetical protein
MVVVDFGLGMVHQIESGLGLGKCFFFDFVGWLERMFIGTEFFVFVFGVVFKAGEGV